MVLDDVTEAGHLSGLWPQGRDGAVVVTSRLRGLAPGQGVQIAVDVFTESEAVAYLADKLLGSTVDPGRSDALDDATALAADLGFLPLALAHAGSVIAHEAITCDAYRRRFHDRSAALDELFPAQSADEYAHTVATTWALAVERADARGPVGLARPALSVAAVLDPNGVSDAVWATRPVLDWVGARLAHDRDGTSGPTRDVNASDLRRALRNLHHLSLITHDPNGGPLAVRTHAMVQRAVVDSLTGEEVDSLVPAVADGLVAIWPDPENRPALSQSLRANATTLIDWNPPSLWRDGCHPLLHAVGNSLGAVGLVAQAVTYFTDLTRTARQVLGATHADTLTAQGNVADWRGEAGDPAGAMAASRELLSDHLRILGPDHPHTLTTRHNLAYWRGHAGDPAGAATAFEALLPDYLRVLGSDHPHTLAARGNVADWRGQAGDPAGAMAASRELLSDYLRVLGPDHPHTLNTRHSIADWRGQAGDHAGAATEFERVLADRLRVLGPDHPDTLTSRQNLSYWRGHAGDPAGALAAVEGVLADRLRVLGPDHPDTLATRGNLVHWLGESGDPVAAVVVAEELLADRLRVLGPDHPDTLTTRHNVALWRGHAGDPAAATAEFERLLDDCLRLLGADHPHTLATRHNVAHWRGECGDPAGAAAELERLLEDRLRLLGADHPHTCITSYDLDHWRRHAVERASGVQAHHTPAGRIGGEGRHRLLLTDHDVTYWRRQARRTIRRSWQRNTRRLPRP